MATDKIIRLQIGVNGGVIMNGRYATKEMREYFSEEIKKLKEDIEKGIQSCGVEVEIIDTRVLREVDDSGAVGQLTKYIGDYFEYAVYSGLLKAAQADKDITITENDISSVNQRKRDILGKLNELAKTNAFDLGEDNRVNMLIAQADSLGQDGGRKFWEAYKKGNQLSNGKINAQIEWLGKSGPQGDIHLKINGIHIMVEAKFYRQDSREISYFTSLVDVDHFRQLPFWEYLKDKGKISGKRVWAKEGEPPIRSTPWIKNIYAVGLTGYMYALGNGKSETSTRDANALLSTFNYILAKGSGSANLKVGEGEFNVDKRGLISGGKLEAGSDGGTLTVDIDLTSLLQSKFENNLELHSGDGEVLFKAKLRGKKRSSNLMKVAFASKMRETFDENSRFATDPFQDGPGWKTIFDVTLYRNALLTRVNRK